MHNRGKEWLEACKQLPDWEKRGKELIYPERAEEWEIFLDFRVHLLNNYSWLGQGLNEAIEIMQILENGTLEDAKQFFEQQSDLIRYDIRDIVFRFSKKGPEFYEYTANGEISREKRQEIEAKKCENAELEELHSNRGGVKSFFEEKKQQKKHNNDKLEKEKAIKLDYNVFDDSDLERAVSILQDYRSKRKSVYIVVNSTKLYSCDDITIDSAYLSVFGKTKEEYDREKVEGHRVYEEDEKSKKEEMQELVESSIARSKDIIYPEREEEWKEHIEKKAEYNGDELNGALEIMQILENGTLDEAKQFFDKQGYSARSAIRIMQTIFLFSKRGPEFYEHIYDGDISEMERANIENKKRENAEIELQHKVAEITSLKNEIEEIEGKLREAEQLRKDLEAKKCKLKGLEGK